MEELTFGQEAVGLEFNPSGDPEVIRCKQIFADAIDQMNDLRNESKSAEARRHASTAITLIEGAQMRAVRALTWKDKLVDFEVEVLEKSQEKLVLVDFFTPTCGPCIQVAPLLKELAEKKDFVLVKVNAFTQPDLARKFNVMGVPRLVLINKGETVWDSITDRWANPVALADLAALEVDRVRTPA